MVGKLVSPVATATAQPYAEIFVLSQMSAGEYYVANQCFRLIKD